MYVKKGSCQPSNGAAIYKLRLIAATEILGLQNLFLIHCLKIRPIFTKWSWKNGFDLKDCNAEAYFLFAICGEKGCTILEP